MRFCEEGLVDAPAEPRQSVSGSAVSGAAFYQGLDTGGDIRLRLEDLLASGPAGLGCDVGRHPRLKGIGPR